MAMAIQDVRDILLKLGIPVYHLRAPEERADKYLHWGETSIGCLISADNQHKVERVRGQIYYYTSEEYDPLFNVLCKELNESEIEFAVTDVGYDSVQRQIAYIISWEINCNAGEVYR